MSIFERVIPFPERLQWLMLKSALAENVSAATISARLGWGAGKMKRMVWGSPLKIKLDDVAHWFWACGGQMPRFTLLDAVTGEPVCSAA